MLWRLIPFLILIPLRCLAQDTHPSKFFAGGGPGLALLSGGGASAVSAARGSLSSYSASAGLLVHAFGGVHLNEYFSIQGAWNWNRNALQFSAAATSGAAFQQSRTSSQNNSGADLVVYFKPRNSRIRPFITGGLNLMRISSDADPITVSVGAAPTLPRPRFTASQAGLRVAAGADFMLLPRGWGVRYAFHEITQRNPIGRQLSPQAGGPLMNFQHLFGVVRYFR